MFMWKAKCMPNLVQRRANAIVRVAHGDVPSKIHGARVFIFFQDITANVRPGSVAIHKSNTDFSVLSIFHFFKFQTDPQCSPHTKRPAYYIHLWFGADPGLPLLRA